MRYPGAMFVESDCSLGPRLPEIRKTKVPEKWRWNLEMRRTDNLVAQGIRCSDTGQARFKMGKQAEDSGRQLSRWLWAATIMERHHRPWRRNVVQ